MSPLHLNAPRSLPSLPSSKSVHPTSLDYSPVNPRSSSPPCGGPGGQPVPVLLLLGASSLFHQAEDTYNGNRAKMVGLNAPRSLQSISPQVWFTRHTSSKT